MECDLLIKNARVFDGAQMRDGFGCVGIAGKKISFVDSPAINASHAIDAAGRFLLPGLIDSHVHLLNMWTAIDETSMAADIEGELPKRLSEFLAAGVTTVKSVGDSEDDILRVRAMIANGDLTGRRRRVLARVRDHWRCRRHATGLLADPCVRGLVARLALS